MALPAPPARVVGAAVAVILVAGAVAAGLSAGPGEGSSVTSGAAPAGIESPAAEPGSAESGVTAAADGGPATPIGDGGSPTEASTAGGGEAGAADARTAGGEADQWRPRAPAAGTYRYLVTHTNDGGEPEERDDEVQIEDVSRGADLVRQRLHNEESFGPAVSDIVWTADGMRIEVTRFQAFGDSACDWEPDLAWHRFPLDEGAKWSYRSSCTVTVHGVGFTIDVEADVTVGSRSTVDVAGTPVAVTALQRRTTVTMSGQAVSGTSTSTERELFAPSLGLPVSSKGSYEAQMGEQRRSGTMLRRLLSVRPA